MVNWLINWVSHGFTTFHFKLYITLHNMFHSFFHFRHERESLAAMCNSRIMSKNKKRSATNPQGRFSIKPLHLQDI